MHEIGHELMHAMVHVDRSALSLVRQLAVHPGRVALDYVSGRRKRHFGPFAFLVVVVALASAAIALSGFRVVSSDVPNASVDFLQHHVNLVLFAQVPVLAGICRLLETRGPYNYAEYLVLAAYTKGMQVLFLAAVVIPVWYILAGHQSLSLRLYYLYLVLAMGYYGFALWQFVPGRHLTSAFKGVVAALATQAVTYGTVIFGVLLFDWLRSHG
jgi:hypothetical protein